MTIFDAALLDRFTDIVGAAHALRDRAAQAPYLSEWRDHYHGATPLVLRPGSTREVAAIMRLAREAKISLVPQGGNTGLVGGQIPREEKPEILVCLQRLNRIRTLDRLAGTITAEAGVTIEALQQAAAEADLLFPLTLASQGSSQLGGTIATNAGGTAVLAYGNARDLTLGLEVVLPDGEIWDGLRALRKDNAGYDLKQLFIGSEGTLGIITAAVMKLYPRPRETAVAIAGVPSVAAALALYVLSRRAAGGGLTGFEFMIDTALGFVCRHFPSLPAPLARPHPWYVLLEISSFAAHSSAQENMEILLAQALEQGVMTDAVLAQSLAQAADLWRLRHHLSEAQKFEGGSIKHDISVPLSALPAFMEEAIARVKALEPGARPVPFGHLGDGNIHFNISQPLGMDKAAFLARRPAINAAVYEAVIRHHGSVAAEHGIGRFKVELLAHARPPLDLDLMARLKQVFDPDHTLNPGRVLRERRGEET